MWKLKYQLALHLRGQYHYPITTKAAKTHSSSGIIKLSQWEYKASSSLSWWHSSAIWEAIPVCTTSVITTLTSVHLNSSHELKWLKALVAPSCLVSSATGGWLPGHNEMGREPACLPEFQDIVTPSHHWVKAQTQHRGVLCMSEIQRLTCWLKFGPVIYKSTTNATICWL